MSLRIIEIPDSPQIEVKVNKNWREVNAKTIKYGDYLFLSKNQVIKVDTTKHYPNQLNMNVEVQGQNLMNSNERVQLQFSNKQTVKIIQEVIISEHKIVAFDPDDELIFIAVDGVIESIKLEDKAQSFQDNSLNIHSLGVRCIQFNGERQPIEFFNFSNQK